jgi:hypothetical protein
MRNVGALLSDDQFATLATYLSDNFSEKAKPQGALVSGPAQVTFREWTLPTPGTRSHDPLASLDGMIWYTGQMANALGAPTASSPNRSADLLFALWRQIVGALYLLRLILTAASFNPACARSRIRGAQTRAPATSHNPPDSQIA